MTWFPKRNKKRTLLALSAALFIVIGFWLGWYERSLHTEPVISGSSQIRADIKSLKFTNPLLFANSDKDSSTLNPLVSLFNSLIASTTSHGAASSVSVYYRDLNTGRWTGSNEDDTYAPASMIKVIAMMAVLKMAEQDPTILDHEIYYTPDATTKFYQPNIAVKAGYYRVHDLVSNMIIYSDNASANALISDSAIHSAFDFVYTLFRLPPFGTATTTDFMSAKSYSSVFRALYNSTLFQWDLSEQALDLLSRTTFSSGLVKGVPVGTVVSHKFGETGFEASDDSIVHELHDCGIIYYPSHPYLLCVMTRGDDFYKLEDVISSLSKLTWTYTDSEYQ